jgi:acetyl-CoA carboxylase biotin carboxylase subunit
MRAPAGPGVRDDSGAYEGVEITPHYDPLISKLSVWAATREQAVQRMERALREYVVAGIATNIPFHLQLMAHPDFRAGKYDTGFIAEHEDVLLKSRAKADPDVLALASAIYQGFQDAAQVQSASPAASQAISPWRLGSLTRP